jgi:hypothetical protein
MRVHARLWTQRLAAGDGRACDAAIDDAQRPTRAQRGADDVRARHSKRMSRRRSISE